MNKYFIFYNFILKDGRVGIGNMETEINTDITCLDVIKAIEKSVLDANKEYEKVIINNYIMFPDLRKY
ncbi:TPA: hypothetical protein PTV74_002120 [Clostridium botulinum]|nr:hypothetical protein [Clostridium botulinum]HDK7193289.1 hypothetical protein [Clostridium botulinum]HDK7205139.1 hypothetical protein [Clostridium botulinum]HDK7209159.1 hypothetical protein [Clostridium botulinum]HDK7264319.1 hypothetical protein [Clostridium botulinum]